MTREPHITVASEVEGGMVQLSVADNGSGFPEQVMGRVFEPYVTTKPRGTGLGLAIVKKIVEEHGGSVKISNIQPHGAAVTLRLPAAAALDSQARPAARAQV